VSDESFAYDVDGLLYEPKMRAAIASALRDEQRTEYEALLALSRAAFVLQNCSRSIRKIAAQDDPAMRVLMRLHNEPEGVPVDDLLADRGVEVLNVLEQLDKEHMLIREGASVRLSDLGNARMDKAIRALGDGLRALLDGVPPEQLAVMRHVSLRLILNHHALHPILLADDSD
jgi:hypothetical protein